MRDYASLLNELQHDLGFTTPPILTSDMSSREAARAQLLQSFFKKLAPKGRLPEADAAALAKFVRVNARTAEWALPDQLSEAESYLWDLFRDGFRQCIESGGGFDLETIAAGLATGPGASQLADSANIVTKLFGGRLSYYSEFTLRLYRSAIATTGSWANAEMARFQKFGVQQVVGGTLFFVNKTTEISRTCCTESNVDMLIQKAVGDYLELCLDRFYGIRLDTQPDENRRLCHLGSVTGAYGTTDLVSASDSISTQLISLCPLPPFLRAVMRESAGDSVVLPDGTVLRKGMISTMGNGFTFPLQTIIFACVVRAVYIAKGLAFTCPLGRPAFGVFGDDIVVRCEAYEAVNSFLNLLGFEVNDDKSFNTGAFRESCGHDYFLGHQVRGVYVKSLETHQDVVSCINRLTRWSARHNWRLTRTLARLWSWLPDKVPLVPPSLGDDEGLHVPFCMTIPRLTPTYWFKHRYWKKRIRRVDLPEPDEYLPGADALAVGILSGHIRRRERSITSADVKWIPKPVACASDDPTRVAITVVPQLVVSPDVAPLGYSPRERQDEPAFYKIATSAVPYWEYIPSGILGERIARESDSWGRWKATLAGLLATKVS